MTNHFQRNLQALQRADLLVARIWLDELVRRSGLLAFAGLVAVFGLGMANVGGFYFLQGRSDPVWAAVAMALLDFAIAAIILLAARKSEPGPEIEIALEARNIALESVYADARELKSAVDAVGNDLKAVGASVANFAQNPLDVATQKLLVPAILSLLRSVHSKK